VKRLLLTTIVLPFVAFCLHPATHSARAQSTGQSEAIVTRVLERYRAMDTLQARFRQIMSSELFEEDEQILGSMYMRGPSYRILAGNRTMVTDGSTSWIYDAAERQVLIDHYLEDETTLSVHQILSRFDERFRVEGTSRQAGKWRIALSPLDPDDYFQSVELVVRDSDATVTEIELDDANDVHLKIILSQIRANPQLDADLFEFQIPEGVEIIDLRSE
jgi:outer membrane lipoprotein carrier protein